jgi:lipopolysaccharide export system protein LptC
MTEVADNLGSSLRKDRSHPGARRGAFEAANRHSLRVRLLRWAIPFAAVVAAFLLIGVVLVDPFRSLPANVSVSRAGLNGSHIVMDLPKLSGFRKDGREYDVTATSAVQDINKPSIIELNGPDAKINISESGVVHVSAETGVFDSSHDTLVLRTNVHLRTDSGYDAILKIATIDLKAGTMVSNEPVSVVLNNATIVADRMQTLDSGRIMFEGNVHSVLNPAAATGSNP